MCISWCANYMKLLVILFSPCLCLVLSLRFRYSGHCPVTRAYWFLLQSFFFPCCKTQVRILWPVGSYMGISTHLLCYATERTE